MESPEDKFGVSTGQGAKGFPAAFAVCAEREQLPAPRQAPSLLPVSGYSTLPPALRMAPGTRSPEGSTTELHPDLT